VRSKHREADAEKLFKRVIVLKPSFSSARVNLGHLYAQMDRNDDAIAQLQQALRLEPNRQDALAALVSIWRTQARAAAQAGELEKGLSILLQARKVAPKEPSLLFDFGMIALRMSLLPMRSKLSRRNCQFAQMTRKVCMD
jgi:tetratricopeptide (TPR) repeat protein